MARKTLEAVGFSALGLGFFFQAARAAGVFGLGTPETTPTSVGVSGVRRSAGVAGLGRTATPGEALRNAPKVIEKVTTRTVKDIQDRVSYIQDRIRKDSLKPEIREKALAVLTRKEPDPGSGKDRWVVPEKDAEAEVVALFNAVRDPASPLALRYTRDHVEVDQYHSANKLFQLKGGDCDDGSILLGSMLRAVGYPVRLRVIQDTSSSTWSHIYLLAGIPPGRADKWIPLDWSVPGKEAGWEAPGAKQVALTGRPSGVVEKLLDFKV